MLLMFLFSLSTGVKAQVPATVNIYTWVDKPQYQLGETGTLYITIRNDGEDSVEIRNVSIEYPWFAYVKDHWEGNETITLTPAVALASKGGVWNREVSFTVPTDGRATTAFGGATQITITFAMDTGYSYKTAYISIASTPYPMSIQNIDELVNILTIQSTLLFIGLIVVAIAAFLATRRSSGIAKVETAA